MPEEHLAYFRSNPSSKSINCMAELLLLEKFKQREALQVLKSIISLQKWEWDSSTKSCYGLCCCIEGVTFIHQRAS